MASGGIDEKVRLWSIAGHAPVVLPAGGPIAALRFHPDGRTLLVAEGKRLIAWDLPDPTRPPSGGREVGAHESPIVAIAVFPGGKSIGTVGMDAAFRLWPGGGGSPLGHSIRTPRYRYTEWGGGEFGTELYDYQQDPEEFTNLAGKPEHETLQSELKSLLARKKRDAQ